MPNFRNLVKMALPLLAAFVLASCQTIIPNSGPTSGKLARGAASYVKADSASKTPYVLVDATADIAKMLPHTNYDQFDGAFINNRGPLDVKIGYGDVIRVTIFESGSGGLFTPKEGNFSPGNFVSVPDQEVDRSGTVKVPYVGDVSVVGRRPSEVQTRIEAALRDRAIEPEIVVSLVTRNSARVTVVGTANNPGVFPLSPQGERVLEAIGFAGGSANPDYDTLVSLQRGSKASTVRMSALVDNPSNNVFLAAGDTVTLSPDPRFFNVFGSTNVNGQVTFASEELHVSDALGLGGGLVDAQADPRSVLVYRFLPRRYAEQLGADLSDFVGDERVPVIFRLDLGSPEGYFVARQMPVVEDDILYVTTAPLQELVKLLNIINTGLTSANTTADTVNAIDTIRAR